MKLKEPRDVLETRQGECTCGVVVVIRYAKIPVQSTVTDIEGHPHLCPNSHAVFVARYAR